MRHRSVLTAFLASLLLLIGPPITAQALPDSGSGSGSGSLSASPCHPGTPPTVPKTTNYYDGQEYLGPDPLPQDPPVGPLLTGYQRFGNLTEAQFIAKYRTPDNSMWIYPPDDGFLIIDGRTAAHPEVLQPGKRIDRFGAPSGKFLAQEGESYGGRAIPPQNLNSPGAPHKAIITSTAYSRRSSGGRAGPAMVRAARTRYPICSGYQFPAVPRRKSDRPMAARQPLPGRRDPWLIWIAGNWPPRCSPPESLRSGPRSPAFIPTTRCRPTSGSCDRDPAATGKSASSNAVSTTSEADSPPNPTRPHGFTNP